MLQSKPNQQKYYPSMINNPPHRFQLRDSKIKGENIWNHQRK